MALLIGTSGWQYRDWRGRYYPPGVPTGRWFDFHAARFATVELNVSFYRLPRPEVFEAWGRRAPAGFTFVVKASRYLSHVKRLVDPEEPVRRLLDHAAPLGDHLGPFLLQLPPTMRAEPERLDRTLRAFGRHRVAVEPRHPSWDSDEVHAVLRAHDAPLVWTDRRDAGATGPVTASWGYVRFHEGTADPWPRFTPARLRWWARHLADAYGHDAEVFAFFNNDPGAAALVDAVAFAGAAADAGLDPTRVPEPEVLHLPLADSA